jgi:nucleoside transporter
MTNSAPASSPARTATPLRVRLSVMMFLQYFVQGAFLPVISIYLQDALGFNAKQLGTFGAALAIGPLVSPFIIGQLVDRHISTERVLAFCHLTGGMLMLVLYFQSSYTVVLVLGTLFSTLYAPSMMLTNSLAFHHLLDRDRDFPVTRLWGTIGFIVPAWLVEPLFLSGLEDDKLNSARGIVLVFAGISGLIMGLYSLTLPHTPPHRDNKQEIAPGKVLGMFRLRNFLVLVLISFVVALVHKFYFVWNGPYLTVILERGNVTGWEQRISSIGQVFEIVVMAMLGFSIRSFGFKWTMTVGTIAYLVRCLIFAGAISVEAAFPAVMTAICFGQALHGFCFGCFLAAAFMYVDRVAPVDVRGTMQNFYGTFVLGVGFLVGGLLSGEVGDRFTTELDKPTVRSTLGIESQAGVVDMTQKKDGRKTEMRRDWTGLWLGGAVLATVALVGFVLLFPSDRTGNEESAADQEPSSESDAV